MDTLSSGYPLFEFGQIFNSLIGFSEVDPETVKRFQGFDLETSKEFWHRVLAAYLGTKDEEAIRAFEAKAKVLGYLKLLRRLARDNSLETENGKKEYAVWKEHLMEALAVTDTLLIE